MAIQTNKAIIEIEVDPNGRGQAAIRGINTSLGSLGVSAPGVAANVTGVGRSINLLEGAIATVGVARFTGEIIGAGKQASDANRLISASAKEAGLAYELVTAQAERFAARTSQAEVAAQRTYASILQFSKAAEQTGRVEEFTRAFADLAAARGIQAAQLGDIARQLQALTDEATDKLLGANPSAFFAGYAQSVGKTAGAITDAEKRAAIFDEVIRRGALFSGEADRRLGDVAGKLDTVSAKIENLKALVGRGATAKGGPLDAILSAALFGAETFAGGGAFAGDPNAGKGVQLLLAEGEQRAKLVVEQLREQERKVAEAMRDPFGSFENLVLSKAAPRVTVFDQDPAAREQIFQQAREEARAFRDRLKKTIEETLKDDATPISVLKLARTQLTIFEPEDERKFAQAIEEAIRKRVEALTKPIQEVRAETGKLLDDLTSRAAAQNPFVRFFSEADASAKSFARTTAELRERYGELADGVIGQLERITGAQRAAIAEGALEQRFADQLGALGLRQEAAALRRGDGGLQARLDRSEKEDGVTRLDVLANLMREIASGRVVTSSAQGALAIFGQGGEDSAQVRNAQEAIERIRAIQADALARGFDPAAAQRLADKFALDATGRLGADALRDSPELRQLRIEALDRQASRLGSREEEARARAVEDLKSRERLSTELDRLTRAVQLNSEKLDKGAFTFRFVDESGGRLALDGALGAAPSAEPTSPGYGQGWRY